MSNKPDMIISLVTNERNATLKNSKILLYTLRLAKLKNKSGDSKCWC